MEEPRFAMTAHPLTAKVGKLTYQSSMLVAASTLPKGFQQLLEMRISQINGCGFCLDVHVAEATAAGESAQRIGLVAAWRHTTVFTEAERAALELAEAGTRLADDPAGVSDEIWANVRAHYDDEQVAALLCLIALMNASNRFGVLTRALGGSYRSGVFEALDAAATD